MSSAKLKSYKEKYQIVDHEARFKLAQSISSQANGISIAKETHWVPILKGKDGVFSKLIRCAHQTEKKSLNARQIVESVRVCVPFEIILWPVVCLTNLTIGRMRALGNTASKL